MTVLCTDGNPLSQASAVTSLYLAGGNRADVLFKAPSKPGTYQLNYTIAGKSGPQTQLVLTIKVEGAAMDMPLYAGVLPTVPLLKPIAQSEIVRQRNVVYGLANNLFTVDGVTFGKGQPQQDVTLGTAEEWTVTDTTGFPHSFHIHVNPFQPVSSPSQPLIQSGQWMDTLEVPPNGSITFRTRFTDFTGTFVLHCHYLPHEDAGLMQIVNVLPPPLKP
jgi:FtsP/CotA-like multicopper oxidase with cupredoxin domain